MARAPKGNSSAFGRYLRAARLRFGHSKRHAAFIRMTRAGPGRTRVEVVPDWQLVPCNMDKTEHIVWYDEENREAVLDALACMRGVKPRVRLEFFVDDDGREVRAGQGGSNNG